MRQPSIARISLALLLLVPAPTHGRRSSVPRTRQEGITTELRHRLASRGTPERLTVRGQPLHNVPLVARFYEARVFRPAWSGDRRAPLPRAGGLLDVIRSADREALRPDDYHLRSLETLLGLDTDEMTAADLADLDLLLTDAYLLYASHLLSGRVDPVTIDPQGIANRREMDLVGALGDALASDRIRKSLLDLLPDHAGYRLLRTALTRYRAIAREGDWPAVPPGPKLQEGDRDPRVRDLRQRLTASGELEGEFEPSEPERYDARLAAAVRRFQTRHGLEPDGIAGPSTIAELSVSAEARARTVALNMERWRWLPRHLGDTHVIVNVANFELDVVESGRTALSMRVVVGRPYRRTPVFTDTMTYVVLSPYWHVPRNLAVQDLLPRIKGDPGYLAALRFTVFQPGADGFRPVDPGTIDWSRVTSQNFEYRLRQDPGPANALGRIKFMFPNRFNVYLHDTPSRELFTRAIRDFSSGCIRLEKPIELAEYVLRDGSGRDRTTILRAIESSTDRSVRLPRPIPIHLLYWTAFVGEDGALQFRKDIYSRDAALDEALRERPSGPGR